MEQLSGLSNELERALITINRVEARRVFEVALQYGQPIDIAGHLISKSLRQIGDLWENGELSLSQVFMSGVICEELIEEVLPASSPNRIDQPTMAIGVFEDHHLLGKRIIYSSLRASGFELIDLGGGLTIDDLVKSIQEKSIKILLLSVLMLPSALRIKDLKKRIEPFGVTLIVGGAPFNFDKNLWNEVGADGYGSNPSEAIHIVNREMNNRYE